MLAEWQLRAAASHWRLQQTEWSRQKTNTSTSQADPTYRGSGNMERRQMEGRWGRADPLS